MPIARRIRRVTTVPPLRPGFVGPGHLAAPVLAPLDFHETDPFVALMDDHLDIGDRSVGGPHPHAGFETVTLILDGAIFDRDEGGTIEAGEVQWMTAGSGIIHGENVAAKGKVRLLQLWLTLPKKDRWTTPGFQDIHKAAVPVRQEPGADVRVYSGASGSARSGTRNHVPVTLLEFALEPNASIDQEIPIAYNGFFFVIRGSVRAGDDAVQLKANQTGWLDRPEGDGTSTIRLTAGDQGGRVGRDAGQPQNEAIVSHGTFIGDTRDDIVRLYQEYRAGKFERMSNLARQRRVESDEGFIGAQR